MRSERSLHDPVRAAIAAPAARTMIHVCHESLTRNRVANLENALGRLLRAWRPVEPHGLARWASIGLAAERLVAEPAVRLHRAVLHGRDVRVLYGRLHMRLLESTRASRSARQKRAHTHQ